ncbi:hypothetical protein [Streptomyces sp. NPDC054834]
MTAPQPTAVPADTHGRREPATTPAAPGARHQAATLPAVTEEPTR